MPIRDEAINVFMGLPGRRRPPRADLQPRRRLLRARHRLQPHRDHRLGPRRDAGQARRAGHRAREAALHRARGRLADLLRRDPDGYRIELIERATERRRTAAVGCAHGRADRRRRPRVELVPPGGLHVPADGWWKRTDEIYEAVRIGEGLAATGELGEAGMARAQATMEVFAHFCAASGIEPDAVLAVATSAHPRRVELGASSSSAPRRPAACACACSAARRRRATATWRPSTRPPCPTASMLDIGGGSMQLVHVVGRHSRELDSWRLGAVRMSERFLPGDGPAKPKQIRELVGYVTAKLERAPWLGRCGPRLVGIGGTIRNLAAAAQRDLDVPEAGVQGYRHRARGARPPGRRAGLAPAGRARQVPRHQARARRHHPRRRDRRADGHGGRRLRGPRGRPRPACARASSSSATSTATRRCSTTCAARASSTSPRSTGWTPAQPAHRPRRAPRPRPLRRARRRRPCTPGDPVERELLWAAALLHDIGMTVDYDDHHKHSRYLVLNAGLPGLRAARARPHRPGRALPPQGHAVAGPVRPAGASRATRSA